jgi:hypothetical protein
VGTCAHPEERKDLEGDIDVLGTSVRPAPSSSGKAQDAAKSWQMANNAAEHDDTDSKR